MDSPIYNPYEERILRVLQSAYRPLTTMQVVQYSGISYNTVKDYLEKLFERGKVKKTKLSNRIFWEIR